MARHPDEDPRKRVSRGRTSNVDTHATVNLSAGATPSARRSWFASWWVPVVIVAVMVVLLLMIAGG